MDRDLRASGDGLGGSENDSRLEDRGLGALLGGLERRKALDIVTWGPLGTLLEALKTINSRATTTD